MPQPGEAIPYPPHPAFGAASGQYALEQTQLRIADQILGAEGANPPVLPAGGVGALARLRQILEQLQAGGGGAKDQTLQSAVTQLLALVGKDFATQAKQDTGNTSLATIAGKDFATQTTLAALKARSDLLGTEVTLLNIIGQQALMVTALGDILAAAQAIAIDADSIAIDADTINLNTDALENIMGQVRDRLKLGQSTNAASSGVVLSVEQQTILEALLTRTQFEARINTLGRKASAASTPVVLSDEQEAKVDLLAKEATLGQRNNLAATTLNLLPSSTGHKTLRLKGHGVNAQFDYHFHTLYGSALDAAGDVAVRFRRVGPSNAQAASYTRAGVTVTVTHLLAHNLETGDVVFHTAAADAGLNQELVKVTVTSPLIYTYTTAASGAAAGAITLQPGALEVKPRTAVAMTALGSGW